MASKLRTDFQPGEVFHADYINRANAQTNANTQDLNEVKDNIAVTAENAEKATQAAVDTAGYVSNLKDAIAELPDGQAVTAEVADHEVRVSNIEDILNGNGETPEEIVLSANDNVARAITFGQQEIKWSWGSTHKHQCISCVSGDKFKITANSSYGYMYCFLKSYDASVIGDTSQTPPAVDFATGYSESIAASINSVTELTAPSDAHWLYILTLVNTSTNCIPSEIIKGEEIAGDGLIQQVENKVDKVQGKGLSTNDFTNADKAKVASIATIANDVSDLNRLIVGSESEDLDLSEYDHTKRFISEETGEWVGLNSNGYHLVIPCAEGDRFVITPDGAAGGTSRAFYSFLNTYNAEDVATQTPAPAVDYADGYDGVIATPYTKPTDAITAPHNAHYLYIGLTYGNGDYTPNKVTKLGVESLTDKVDELNDAVKSVECVLNGLELTDAITKYIVYDDGSIYTGWTAGGYWFKNIGYSKVVAKLGWNNTTYAAIAFFNNENPSPSSYMKSASVQHNGSASNIYEADVPEGCKMICISNRNNSLANPEISLYYTNSELVGNVVRASGSAHLPSIKDIEGMVDAQGYMTETVTFIIDNTGNCNPLLISSGAIYSGSTAPTIQYSVGTYNSIPFTIGGNNELKMQQWRIPPMTGTMPNATITITIPSGTTLRVDSFSVEYSNGNTGKEGITRINSHLGFLAYAPEQTLASIAASAIMGYKRCIVNPIRTSDGVWMCYHGGKAYLSPDGTKVNAIAIADEDFANYTYAQIRAYEIVTSDAMHVYWKDCKVPTLDEVFALMARTGMQPIFSVHPSPTENQWLEIKALLTKYELLDKTTIKVFSITDFNLTKSVFGNSIESYIYITYVSTAADIATACDNFIANKGDITVRLGLELGTASTYTNECISVVVNKGLYPTVESYANNVSDGETFKQLMALGATDFTDDINPNCGLNW